MVHTTKDKRQYFSILGDSMPKNSPGSCITAMPGGGGGIRLCCMYHPILPLSFTWRRPEDHATVCDETRESSQKRLILHIEFPHPDPERYVFLFLLLLKFALVSLKINRLHIIKKIPYSKYEFCVLCRKEIVLNTTVILTPSSPVFSSHQ